MLEDCAATQRDPGRMEKWADRDLVKFNRGKCEPQAPEHAGADQLL